MSKRPSEADGVMSRLRRPTGRLRDLPIWSKLGLIMLVPTVATIIVGVNGLVEHIDQADTADNTRTLATLAQAAGGLVDQLQDERAYAMQVVLAPKSPKGNEVLTAATKKFNDEHAKVEAAKDPYAQQRAALDTQPDRVNLLLSRLDHNLADLAAYRSKVTNNTETELSVQGTYNALITDLLAVRDVAAQQATDTGLSDHLRAVAEVARVKEFVSQQRFIGLQVIAGGKFSTALRQAFLTANTGIDLAERNLKAAATDGENEVFLKTTDQNEAQRAATNLTEPLQATPGTDISNLHLTAAGWDSAMAGYDDTFRQVEQQLDKNIVNQATDLRNTTNRTVFVETSVLLGMLLLAILFAWLVARSMARSLRELRQGALAVAQFGLPHAVSRLRDPALSTSLTPAQVADQIAEPLPVRSRDEFGQVTEAFNAVHLEAVRTAAEQAALRASVATMFVNLARRSQILVDRLIGHLDRLERGEEDPDRLAELFQLDHLATRMRRNDENLLVLAGADSTRVQREPAALIDVLRAAQSEVEHYTRIEFGVIDREIEVAAHAVNDMVHLVAELFDNATAFSPPNSNVLVEARRVGETAVLTVEDHGIGISREQLRDLNERLANPPTVDVAVSRMMGLVVVARLANRHSVRVELRPADRERGTVAEVGLPVTVLAAAVSGRMGGYDAPPAAMPSFGEPLALESGRGGYPGVNGSANGSTNGGVPAWSDLTGAAPSNGFGGTNGFNGGPTGFGSANGFGATPSGFSPPANGFGGQNGSGPNGFGGQNGFGGAPNGFGPRSNEPMPPLPSGPTSSGPQGFAGLDELVQRRNGNDYQRPDGETGGFGATIPRQLPANPESQGRSSFMPPVSAPPVPSAPPVTSAPPVPSAPPVSAAPISAEPTSFASAPPAWPPVAGDRETATPHVPENLAAALDMTAEIPRYRPDTAEQRPEVARPIDPPLASLPASAPPAYEAIAPVSGPAADQATAAAQISSAREGAVPFADETMELPIFRELESAWFTTTQATAAKPSVAGTGEEAVISQRIPTGEPTTRTAGVPQQAASPEARELDTASVGAAPAAPAAVAAGSYAGTPSNPWQTAADEGWQAARKASEVSIDTTTTAGLPKRTPMAQLVPGGVDRGGNSVQRRTPEGVRGLLSAYHRGVQRGRTKEQSTNLEETPGGQQPSQAGKEHEA
ncbi:histidine kinase [Actinoplanes sp. SE50]|uniref:sensor histidine kinase n=1 Tax=unclassified Actinoplanes TaxID=2626549 RepID=UPI00023EDDC1|nr:MULTISPECIES: nitrate- and nitrite sensing domain-containing protein [unclassified Actinoplanes]AEV88643.1 Sensor protein torS [Actinoplanes sp. SE50/110]ATO87047.1 histidine kinase [Actinoplanes sp. SE50]SLM04465.1 Sensor histidine kinase [Actinoplanes sp. SE50/110]